MKIYISGKVTGLPRDYALAKFECTKQELLKLGFAESEIWNPMEHVSPDATWEEAMTICLAALEGASAIVMQKDWGDSPGACKELDVAIENGIFFYFEAMGDMEMIRKEVLENRFKIREWGRQKTLVVLMFFALLFSSCNLYEQPETVELRYSIDVTHCNQTGSSTFAVKVTKPTKAAMAFECKNCTLRYTVHAIGDYPGENTVICTTAESFKINGKNSIKYNQY
jgi:hypothetical protein